VDARKATQFGFDCTSTSRPRLFRTDKQI
jgi:hypothetical protein